MYCVAIKIHGKVYRLESHARDAPKTSTIRNRPPASRIGIISVGCATTGLVVPVRGDNRSAVDVPTPLQVVGDEVLQSHLVDGGAMSGAGNREDIVH